MSVVEICNRALTTYLGLQTITSLTEANSPAAQQCALHYEPVRDMLLERHWWNFATARSVLAELVNDRSTEWAYKYAYPGDALAIRWVNDANAARAMLAQDRSPDTTREITADAIYSDVPYATCEFTKAITDVTVFPQYFREAISAAMAAAMAIPLTESRGKSQNAQDQAVRLLDAAIVLDERNTPVEGFGELPSWMIDRGVT